VIDTASGVVRQVINMDDAFQSIVFTRDGSRAYVAGGSAGVVGVLDIDASGTYSKAADLPVGTFVSGLAVSADGRRLWLAEPQANKVVGVDPASARVTLSATVLSPDLLALSPDERTVYASRWRAAAVAAVDSATGRVSSLAVGAHPGAIATTPAGQLLTADANDATLATVNPGAGSGVLTDLAQIGRRSDAPNALALARDGTLYVSLGADNAIAVMRPRSPTGRTAAARAAVRRSSRPTVRRSRCRSARQRSRARRCRQGRRRSRARRCRGVVHRHHPRRRHAKPLRRCTPPRRPTTRLPVIRPQAPTSPWRLAGLIPTGWYPTALALSPDSSHLFVVTARGLARSAGATVPFTEPDPVSPGPDAAYATVGTLETIAVPDSAGLAADTATVRRTLAPRTPPPSTATTKVGVLRPIRHVIYITRENKTFDADLGDLHPGPGTALTLFGQSVTPNLHALERQFAEPDNFSYQGFASVVGHMWEDTGTVSDLYERAVASNTAGHVAHVSDSWSDPTNYPASGLLVAQAHRAGLSVRTYNEELAQQSHLLPAALQADPKVFPDYNLHVPDATREKGWESEFAQFERHRCEGALAAAYGTRCSLPALEYVYFGEDHTTVVDEPGYPTIQAQVADNDYATGKLIDAVSHSPDWASTLVIVVEDDPQGTGDHASAYHGLLAVASPYIKRGFRTDTPYNLTSVVGAIDRVLGLTPITDYALTNRPLDDLFTAKPDLTPFNVDTSGVTANPFVALPGSAPRSDPVHGVYSFARPDATNPAVANAATWRQVRGTRGGGGPAPAR
jgi:DNA-binding beta-propeller fold protein YncE